MIRIRTPSRIHITLIDLNGSIGRIDGGIGFALREPFIDVKARGSRELKIHGKALNMDRFREIASSLSKVFKRSIELEVISDYRSHVGLGSGTQMSLAVAEAYNRIFDLGFSVRELAEITKRGGTSGIGVAVFEFGGFILDGGHSRKEKPEFLPSSASKAKPAPVLVRYDFPDWKVVLAIPNMRGFYGRREVDLFKKFCPIPVEEVRELCHLILMKVLPSIVECDLDEFGRAIYRIQQIGFKRIEVDMYGDLIRGAIDFVSDLTKAVGMSSTGPAMYAVTDSNSRDIKKSFEEYFRDRGLNCDTMKTRAKNSGAEIKFL